MNIGEDFIDVTFVGKTSGNSGTDTSIFSVFTRFPKHTCPYTFQAYMNQKMEMTDSIKFEKSKDYTRAIKHTEKGVFMTCQWRSIQE